VLVVTRNVGPENAIDFGRRLRELRAQRGLTQQVLADELSVQRATFSQWETGRHLPSDDNVAVLDRRLEAGGELTRLAGSTQEFVPGAPTIRTVFDRLGRALLDRLLVDDDGRPTGWRHDLTNEEFDARPLSTALGLKTLLLVDGPYVDTAALVGRLEASRSAGGAWDSSGVPDRPEATAAIADALCRVGAYVDLDDLERTLQRLLDEPSRRRVYVVATVLEFLARTRPDSALAIELVDTLLEIRRTTAQVAVWPEKAPNARRSAVGLRPEPSVPHTARAMIALGPFRDRQDVADALGTATEWLTRADASTLARENLSPREDRTQKDLEFRHFTPALVARALCLAPDPPEARVQTALDALWRRYQSTLGLWSWPNLDVPVWLQYDAAAAIRLAGERTSRVPVGTGVTG
jgi:transcriptional regulator with XRE-family HTH domain